jgi:hypothetical protein
MRGVQWNRIPGRMQIRIFASKEQARAGVVSFQSITEPVGGLGTGPPKVTQSSHGRTKWIVIAAAVGGGIAAGVILGTRSKGGASQTSTVAIGNPSITVVQP